MTTKIAIIGGGIVGLSAAFYLSQEDHVQVSLYDLDKGQATRATGGVICPWLSQRRNQGWYRLVRESAAFYPQFIKDIGQDPNHLDIYKQNGALIFKKDQAALEKALKIGLDRLKDASQMGRLEILSPQAIKKILPIYDKDQSAIFVEGGARVDGKLLVDYLHQHLQELGVTIIPENVDKIEAGPQTYKLWPDQEEYDRLLLSNGAWLGELLEGMNYQVDSLPQKGQLAEVFIDQKDSDSWPVMMPAGGNNIIPMADGRILIGATHEKDEGFSTELIPDRVQPLIEDARQQVSEAFHKPLDIQYRVGIRGYSSDFSIYFGPVSQHDHLYAVNGLGATGLTAGPLIGKLLSQMILGQEPSHPVQAYATDSYIQYQGD